MKKSHGVKRSQRSFDILRNHSDAVLAGMALSSRDRNLAQARCMTERGMRLMFVDFAKDAHKSYLMHLRECKRYDDRRAALAHSIAEQEHALRNDVVRHLTKPMHGDHTDEWIS